MGRVRNIAGRTGVPLAALIGLGFMLGGCGSADTNLARDIVFGGPVNMTGPTSSDKPPVNADAVNNDTPCPDVQIRSGASTLMIGSKPGTDEPLPMDVRYQGSIVTTARECHLNAGLLTIKVGVEGRVITGPAGEPGQVIVPLRIAVVHEGITPRTVVSKLANIPVQVNNAVDRVTFTHVDPDIAFPMPPPGQIDSYVIYVGFDPIAAQPAKKPPPKRKPVAKKPKAPKPS